MHPAMGSTDYKAIVKLGEGGSAIVYLGIAMGAGGFQKLVVLKTLKPNLLADPDHQRMFLNEARLSARLNHANIVQVYEISVQDDRPFIVMEYLEGKPVSHIRSAASGDATRALQLRILCDALAGLHFSHELSDFDGTPLKLVHRDFTPQNVFVTYDGRVKILDFGIAKVASANASAEAGILRGKLRYMAPEQVLGGEVDRRADIYAAGVMAWEAATGTKIWQSLPTSGIIQNIVAGHIRKPSELDVRVDPRLEAIVMRALALSPANRYPTAGALQLDLENYLEQANINLSQRQLAAFMNEHFAEDRKRTQNTLEHYLGQLTLSEDTTNVPVALLSQRIPSDPELSDELANRVTAPISPTLRPKFSRRWGLAAAAVGLVALVVVVSQLGLLSSNRGAVSVEKSAAKPVSPETRLDLSITATPESARLFLDGRPLPSNPYRSFFPADHSHHVLRAEAAGFEPRELAVNFDSDATLLLSLIRASAPRPSQSASGTGAHLGVAAVTPASNPRVPRTQKPSGPLGDGDQQGPGNAHPPANAPSSSPVMTGTVEPNCSPAFRIDESGVKRFKPECI